MKKLLGLVCRGYEVLVITVKRLRWDFALAAASALRFGYHLFEWAA
jgi:hypothetical protein